MYRIGFRLLAIAAFGLNVVPASRAADMPAPPLKAVAPVATPWTGCYLGGNVGYGWANTLFTVPGGAGFAYHTADGVVGGGQAGCDYQLGAFVFGAQGMFDWSGVEGSVQPTPLPGGHSRVTWLSDVTGRIGVTFAPNTLIYAKGGWGWLRDHFSTTNALGTTVNDGRGTLDGWVVGGGMEWLFAPNWSVFTEYNYFGLGSHLLSFNSLAVPGTVTPLQVSQHVQSFVVGVNFRFGNSAGPISVRF